MREDFLTALHKVTPLIDKLLAVTGVAVAGTLTLGHVQAGVGITVGVLTIAALIPRAVIAWRNMFHDFRTGERASEDEGE